MTASQVRSFLSLVNGHIILQHRPDALLALLEPFLDQARMSGAEMGT
jgi:hypothetical protein